MKTGFFAWLKRRFNLGYLVALLISLSVARLIGAAILLSSADLDEVFRLSDRIKREYRCVWCEAKAEL